MAVTSCATSILALYFCLPGLVGTFGRVSSLRRGAAFVSGVSATRTIGASGLWRRTESKLRDVADSNSASSSERTHRTLDTDITLLLAPLAGLYIASAGPCTRNWCRCRWRSLWRL